MKTLIDTEYLSPVQDEDSLAVARYFWSKGKKEQLGSQKIIRLCDNQILFYEQLRYYIIDCHE